MTKQHGQHQPYDYERDEGPNFLTTPAKLRKLGGTAAFIGVSALTLATLVNAIRDPIQPLESCTYTVKDGDRLDELARGRRSITDNLYEANGNKAEIFEGDVLHLGQAACDALVENGFPVIETPSN